MRARKALCHTLVFRPGLADRPSVFDRRRITCVGGAAVPDVVVRILRRHLPEADVRRALRCLQIDAAGGSGGQIQPPPPGVPADSPPALRRATLVIEQYAGQIPGLGDLADRLGLSPRQLQRLFRQHLDTTPQAYARAVRLRQAALMLRHTDMAIVAIASVSRRSGQPLRITRRPVASVNL